MELSSLEIDLLEACWNGEASEQQLAEVTQRLASDDVFRQAAERLKAEMALYRAARERQALRAELKEWKKERPATSTSGKTIPVKEWWRRREVVIILAAAVLTGALLVWHFGFSDSRIPTPSERLVASYFEHYPDMGGTKSGASSAELIVRARQAYERRRYKQAIPLLEEAIRADTRDTLLLIYISVSYIAENQGEKAVGFLESIPDTTESIPQEAVLWYKALAYLQEGRKTDAVRALRPLVAGTGPYREKAVRLGADLEHLDSE